MKKILLLVVWILFTLQLNGQTKLTLDDCFNKSRENYPLIKQKKYIEQSKEYNVSNVWKGYFPQITISGQATYQSDVTAIPFSFPGIKIESLTKDQYKTLADVSQTIYDGGLMSTQADMLKINAEIDDQKIEIELLKLKERVNQIYFGILFLDEQIIQTGLIQKDLNASLDKLSAAFTNGTATKSNVDVLNAESLKIDQREIELKASRKSFLQMLGLLINEHLDEFTQLVVPETLDRKLVYEINRPELKLYSFQEKLFETQNGLSQAKILPKANLFFQGGYGKPTLNMLKNNFDWYYITGARLTWNLSGLYTFASEREITELNKKSVDAQKETFLLNTNLALKQHAGEIEKLEELIKIDKEILEIRTSVKESAKAQLENGVITSSDYIKEFSAEDQARQNLSIHKTQLLLARQNYKLTLGN